MTSIPAPPWRAVFVDALPALLDGVPIAPVDHTALPTTVARATLPNVTLSAHAAFRTAEANARLIGAALAHCRRIATG